MGTTLFAAKIKGMGHYTPKRFGSNAHTNDFRMRPTIPIAPGDGIGVRPFTLFAGINITFGR